MQLHVDMQLHIVASPRMGIQEVTNSSRTDGHTKKMPKDIFDTAKRNTSRDRAKG